MLQIQREIRQQASPERAAISRRFFKTGKGQYAEGDHFCGVRVPQLRIIARSHRDLPRTDAVTLLHSPVHEDRLVALYILIAQYSKVSLQRQEQIVRLYLKSIRHYINNWDLVDTSAEHIVGEYVARTGDVKLLKMLVRSESVWERRVSIVATFYMIKQGKSEPTLTIARMLLHDTHDLIHKAVGWMLRELGKHSRETELREFLDTHAPVMPRTMLRYAIEHFSQSERKNYLSR